MDEKVIYDNEILGEIVEIDSNLKDFGNGKCRFFYVRIFNQKIRCIISELNYNFLKNYLVVGSKVPLYKEKKGVGRRNEFFRFDILKYKKNIIKNGK